MDIYNFTNRLDADATMSMSKKSATWLWEMLMWQCPVGSGRTAFIPESGILVSAFKAEKEDGGGVHVIKTIVSGATLSGLDEEEEEVIEVNSRREENDGSLLYKAIFASGATEWLPASDFIDDDGTATNAWLAFATEEEIRGAYQRFSEATLKVS